MNIYDYILGKVAGHSKGLIDNLINYYGSSEIILNLRNDDLARFLFHSRIQEDTIKLFLEGKDEFDKNKKDVIAKYNIEISKIRDNYGIDIISFSDSEYPKQLKEIKGIPLNLYVKGKINFDYKKSIAIVGTRNVSPYAKEMVSEIAKELSRFGYTIVSGLARGVDGQAHSSTVVAKGKTIAVLPFLSSKVYPPEHELLAKEILESHGAVISENFSPNKIYNQIFFVERNRIISGLSNIVLIVEGSKKSGSLSQYNHAKRQKKIILTLKPIKEHEGTYLPKMIIREGGLAISSAKDIIRLLEKG